MNKGSDFLRRHARLLISLALILATTAAYWRTFQNGFVLYDDKGYVTENPHVQEGITPKTLLWALTTTHAANWHPLTWMSHMVDCRLFGLNPRGHHLTSLLLHLANTVLLFLALSLMTGALLPSAFVAALFALHPLHVESVAWVAERKDVLSAFFWMLAMLAYAHYARRPSARLYGLLAVTFALGLMAKPMLVTLPFALLLLDYWPLGRMRSMAGKNAIMAKNARRPRPWHKLIREKLPLFALALGSSVITFFAQHRGGAVQTLENIPVQERISNALVSYLGYIAQTVWPHNLAVFYPHPFNKLPGWKIAAALLLLACGTWAAIRYSRRHPYLVTGWFWYLGTLVPVIGLVQVGEQAMADRYTYIPSIGLFIIVAWALVDFLPQRKSYEMVLAVFWCIVALVLGLLTWFQVGYWHDSLTLFEHASQAVPDNYLARNNLGFTLAAEGRIDEAMRQYLEALRIKPTYVEAHNNLANAFQAKGQLDEAIAHYQQALQVRPQFFQGHNNLGAALLAKGRVDEALAHYSEALRINPDQPEAHNKLGMKLAALGKIDEAIFHFSEALRLNPDNPEYHNNLALLLGAARRTPEAVDQYVEALRLNPRYPEAHVNLGVALAQQGKPNEAIEHYKQALQLRPEYPEAHINLGIELAGLGRINEAIQHFSEAARLQPNSAEAHYNLGKAHLFLGNRSAAIEESKILQPLSRRLANDLTNLINH
ncbi:MAG TPA: tetratricopeptide repeat protein [Acidobacteriota bacterium]|jgi:tetratricopeptide (TPR) repeat protein